MKRFLVQVTESINHSYEIEAETEEEAVNIYHSYNNVQLKVRDLDGQADWDAHPWTVDDITDDPMSHYKNSECCQGWVGECDDDIKTVKYLYEDESGVMRVCAGCRDMIDNSGGTWYVVDEEDN